MTLTDGLETPLLHSGLNTNKMASEEVWPTEAAAQVRLRMIDDTASGNMVVDGTVCRLRYDANTRFVFVVSGDDADEVVLDVIDTEDMIGCDLTVELREEKKEPRSEKADPTRALTNEPPNDVLTDSQGTSLLTLYCYPRKDLSAMSCTQRWGLKTYTPSRKTVAQRIPHENAGNRIAHHRRFRVLPVEDLGQVQMVGAALNRLATRRSRGLKYLILANPRSGPKRNGAELAQEIVQPILEHAGIECSIVSTTHPKHALEYCTEEDLSRYDGMVLMGGDGIIHEALNGLMKRKDCKEILGKMPIGVIGCGTANGFATSITYASQEKYGPTDEAFLIAKGRTVQGDISKYVVNNKEYISFLTFTYAMIAEVDIESECIHWLGEARFDVWAAWRLLRLRRYRVRFSYLPDTKQPLSSLPELQKPVSKEWAVIEDDIVLFWASQVTHAGMSTFHSPLSSFHDGVFQVMLVRANVSRYRLARILLGLESGSHVNMPGVEFIACAAYRLEPIGKESLNDIDGELVEPGPVQAMVIPKAVQFFGNIVANRLS